MTIGMLSKFRIGAVMAFHNLFKKRMPITSQILITKKCNMNCKMCFVYPVDKSEKMHNVAEPTLEQLKSLIDQSCDLGAQVIVPFGGEPFLRTDLREILTHIQKRKRFCMLYTNGTVMERQLDCLPLIDQLCFSIDGDETTHDAIRGKGTYGKVVQAMEKALALGVVCRMHTALIPDTLGSLDHMCALSKKYNVMLNYGSCDATGLTDSVKSEFMLTRQQTLDFLDRYYQAKVAGYRISSPAGVIRKCRDIIANWPSETEWTIDRKAAGQSTCAIPPCALSFSNIYIDVDGSVFPCLPLWKKGAPNAYEIGLKAAWEHYANLPCHQCASIFTIEKSLFYSAHLASLLDYVSGYGFLRSSSR